MKKSLLFRLGVSMAAIITLAMIGMLSSIFIAENSEGYAAAINQAGTLRMQSYRIASSLVHGTAFTDNDSENNSTRTLVAEFEQRLFSPRIHNVLTHEATEQVLAAYHMVESHWREKIYPHLQSYIDLTENPAGGFDQAILREQNYYLTHVDDFVRDIHAFVKVLELDANRRNEQLRLIQIVSIALTLLVAAISMALTKRTVLEPLKNLLHCAGAARHGDFSVRSKIVAEDELGQLGSAFNVMAADLSKIYIDLEDRVKEKTADLERSNRSLELLYSTTKRLSESPLTDDVLKALIQDIEQLINVQGGTVCLGTPGDTRAFRLASTLPVENKAFSVDCARCLGDGTSHIFQSSGQDGEPRFLFSVPIRDQEKQFGVLLIQLPPDSDATLDEWQKRLLETVASHIAFAINTAQQISQSRMLALQEERGVIARELHDSIAQSLSYLKIQVTRLEKSITDEKGKEPNLEITAGLRSALNGAYRQLRELLTTFRLRISEEGLSTALHNTVREYRDRSGIYIELNDQIANCKFEPNAEIHVIQIIREALSNVIRHSQATHATVSVDCGLDGEVVILVEDDGVGIAGDEEMMDHYGLPIMKERAESLGGELEFSNSPMGGTRVKLTFLASDSQRKYAHEELLQRIRNE